MLKTMHNAINYLKGKEIKKNNNLFFESFIAKSIILNLLNKIHVHKESYLNDIYIFSTFRSGSTWLSEILSSHSGYKLVNEPLSPFKFNIKRNIYPNIPDNVYFYDDYKINYIVNYLEELEKGKQLLSQRYDIFSKKHSFFTYRSVFKLLRASPIIDYLYEKIDMIPVILVRHPIPTIYSKLKSGINFHNRDRLFMENYWYKKKYLTGNQIHYANSIIEKNDILERNILEWCLDNIPLLSFYKNNSDNVILLTYEDLIINTEKVIEKLSDELKLSDKKSIKNNIYEPSSSAYSYSNKRTIDYIKSKKNRVALIGNWENKISNETLEKFILILEEFNIDIYSKEIMPYEDYRY